MTQNSGKYNSPVKATIKGITDLFQKRIPAGKLTDQDRVDGKTILITGASSGLGFAIAVDLAKRGGKVLMACRSGIPQKGEEVKRNSGSDMVEMLQVDLSDITSIDHLVDQLKTQGHKIDILICNAAIVPSKSRKTPQGLEEMFMVNYLAKFILVNSLLDEGLISPGNNPVPRIIFVSSESHRNPEQFEWDQFGKYTEYGMGKTVERYGYFKLLMTTFANELSRRLNENGETKVSVFALCPGPVNSNIAREAPGLFQPLLKLVFAIFFSSPAKAAQPAVYLSASNDVEGKPLDYLFLMSRKEMDPKATDNGNGSKLWELTEQILEKIDPNQP